MSKLASLAAAIQPEKKEEKTVAAVLTNKEDKFEQLKAIEKLLNKKFETTNSVVKLGDKPVIKIDTIPTNLPSVDQEVLGCGGIPRGRIIEIYGPESSGKTTLCLHIVAEEQANTNNLCAYIDAEHSIDIKYAAKLGVNTDELIFAQPDSGEQALETALALIESRTVSLIIIDSVAALVPQAELNGEMGDSNMGLQARLMSQAMRKMRGIAAQNGVTIVFINQIREKIGVMFGSPETTTGGRALKFFASVRLDVRRRELIGSKEIPLGHQLEIKAVKNKVGTPLLSTKVDLIYGRGLDTFKDFIEFAVKEEVIEKSGAWYSFNGERLAQGLTNTVECVRTSNEIFNKIKSKLEEKNGTTT